MRTSRTLHCALVALMGVALTGCSFHRYRSNENYKNLDTTGLKVGESTWLDVLEQLGPPSPGTSETMGPDAFSVSFFKYTSTDRRETDFLFAFYLMLPFYWHDEGPDFELMVEFDREGVVSDIYTTEQETLWKPIESEASRAPRVTRFVGEGEE